MDNPFTLLCKSRDGSAARRGRLTLPHGTVETPAFMPVGTAGAVKGLIPRDIEVCGAEMILANTYHLAIRPGEELVAKAGGLHAFMGWSHPILTDSGGFQVFSLPEKKITDEGVRFRYEVDGSPVFLSPQRAIEIQEKLGADIIMAFDECVPYPCEKPYAQNSLYRTQRWAEACLAAHQRQDQFLFGIVQGSTYRELREEAARLITSLPFDGFAVGGVSVGEGLDLMKRVVEWTAPLLPEGRARYLMGVGLPNDLLEAIDRGMDMFDCVIPTRFARSGTLFTARGKIRLGNRRYRRDMYPPDTSCGCYTCAHFSRAYMRHLFLAKELISPVLAGIHNVSFYQNLMARARQAVEAGGYRAFKDEFLRHYQVSGLEEEDDPGGNEPEPAFD
ncbi:MAG: tRNA guanosine(34) transglycosylase Tgt [Planctomycetota bacterium]